MNEPMLPCSLMLRTHGPETSRYVEVHQVVHLVFQRRQPARAENSRRLICAVAETRISLG